MNILTKIVIETKIAKYSEMMQFPPELKFVDIRSTDLRKHLISRSKTVKKNNRCFQKNINPISAGVLENQDMLGAPPLNPMFDVQI